MGRSGPYGLQDRISHMAALPGPSSPKKPSETEKSSLPGPISRKGSANASARQYRVVVDDFDMRKNSIPTSRSGPLPYECSRYFQASLMRPSSISPRVLPSKEINKSAAKLTIYDAVLEDPNSGADPTAEMDKFQSLLKDYLSCKFFQWYRA